MTPRSFVTGLIRGRRCIWKQACFCVTCICTFDALRHIIYCTSPNRADGCNNPDWTGGGQVWSTTVICQFLWPEVKPNLGLATRVCTPSSIALNDHRNRLQSSNLAGLAAARTTPFPSLRARTTDLPAILRWPTRIVVSTQGRFLRGNNPKRKECAIAQ